MRRNRFHGAMLALGFVLAGAVSASAQVTYSIDSQGPTIGVIDAGGLGPITGGDILVPTPPVGPPPPPTTFISSGPVGLAITPSAAGPTELDALSYGIDDVITDEFPLYQYYFSVDEFAVGFPGSPVPPNVSTEGAAGALEAAADVYVSPPPGFALPPPATPVISLAPPGMNTGFLDGNGGITPFPSPTLNLVEPNPPTFFAPPPDPGDNLDALDVDSPLDYPFVFFSLDADWADPYEAPPPNWGTAVANGVEGADVLMRDLVTGTTVVYAPGPLLGLELSGFPDYEDDDLDALILNDMTDGMPGVYTPTTGPYSWLFGTDMLLFSVRRGSGLIGVFDSLLGLPIEEGDILVPMAGLPPGIWYPAETLGLATVRSGTATFMFGDDLNALDVVRIPEPSAFVLLLIAAGGAGRRRGRT